MAEKVEKIFEVDLVLEDEPSDIPLIQVSIII